MFNLEKNILFKNKINYNLIDFKLFDEDLSYFVKFDTQKDLKLTNSIKKLLFKISKCEFNIKKEKKWIERFNIIKSFLETKIYKFTKYIKNITFSELLDKYQILQSYLLNIKIYNFIDKLLGNISNKKILCSIIKNNNFLFDTKKTPYEYNFEILFELITGIEISNEQMERQLFAQSRKSKIENGQVRKRSH
jgi:hypothetical protein